MTEQETFEQMAAELGSADFVNYWQAYWRNRSEDKEFRAILKPLGLDMPGYVWLSGQKQQLYCQFRKAHDLGFFRGYKAAKETTAEDILAVCNSLERKTRQYENGEFTD